MTIQDDKVKWPSIKKYPCKRLKGEHELEFVSEDHFKMSKYTLDFFTYRCKACGKKIIKDKKL